MRRTTGARTGRRGPSPRPRLRRNVTTTATWKALAITTPREYKLLRTLTEDQLRALAAGADARDIIPNDLGEANEDLTYTPLPPCRLIDTRVAGGIFAANEIRNYDLIGPANYSGIGGNAAGCGIPGVQGSIIRSNITRALVVNIVAVANQGAGDFRAWPTNQTEPLASIINYALPGQGLNLANGVLLQTCNSSCIGIGCTVCGSGDLSFHAEGNGSHLVVDVLGFFRAAEDVSQHSEGIMAAPVTLTTTCANITSCTVFNGTSLTQQVLVQANVNSRLDHASATDDVVEVTLATDTTTCSSPFGGASSGDSGSAWHHVDNAVAASCCFEESLQPVKTFSLAANTTATFSLNGRVSINGGGGFKRVDSANIQCTVGSLRSDTSR